jgi:hypothetical protein
MPVMPADPNPAVIASPSDLTAAWLTEALDLPGGVQVVDFDTTVVGTGQMADTFRLGLTYDPAGGGPPTVIAKFPSSDENSRAASTVARCYEIEVSIYSELPPLPGVPRHHYAARDAATDLFTLLLEDMAPCTQGDDIAGCDLKTAAAALRRLAALHATAWEDKSYAAHEWLNRQTPESIANMTAIVTMLAPSFLERFDAHLTPGHRDLVGRIIPNIATIIGTYDGPRTLIHGDYRLDNMLFRDGSDEPTIVDWQTASYGAPAADVSYFIGGSLTPDDRRAHSAELLDIYHSALVDAGVTTYSREQLEHDVRLTSFGGAVMAFASAILVVQTERGDAMFAEMFRRHAQHVLDLDAESLLPTAATMSHYVTADDEGRHEPDGEELWNESWYADVVTPDGSRGAYVRLGLYPNLKSAWWHVAIVDTQGGPVMCSLTDLPVPDEGLAISTEGLDIELVVDKDLELFSVHGTMTGERFATARDVYGGTGGVAVTVAVDLTWSTDGTPYHYGMTTRYEIPCTVTGTVTVDGAVITLDGPGQRDHSWGVRDWWSFGWCWMSAHLDDGTHLHGTEVRLPGMTLIPGYVQRAGDVVPVEAGSVTETLDEVGLATRATVVLDDVTAEVDPIAYGPILLTAPDGRVGRFPRATAHYRTTDGRQGVGWIEWNQPPAP